MVLLNGRRRTANPGGNSDLLGYDLNALAEPFLERIEISNMFGGARYGTPAVTGAINFVTRAMSTASRRAFITGLPNAAARRRFPYTVYMAVLSLMGDCTSI